MKGRGSYGELEGLKRLQAECQLEHFGAQGWVRKGEDLEEHSQEVRKAFIRTQEIIFSGEWNIVILDEIFNAIWFELIPERETMPKVKVRILKVNVMTDRLKKLKKEWEDAPATAYVDDTLLLGRLS